MLGALNPEPLLDLFWPRSCEICSRPAGRAARYLCWDCLASLPVIEPPYCSRCGDPVEGDISRGYVCSLCVDRTPAFDLARSAVRFRGGIKEVLHRFKYSQAVHLARDLATLLQAGIATHYRQERFDAVCFVPLHPARERSRTYNQARLLAGRVARLLELPLACGCLARVRETGTQTRLNLRERARNVHEAFKVDCPEWVRGRNFLLIDDVMTTGATVNEAARVLKRAGCGRVCVMTAARG
ncbi:MAG: ComF family protein [bacterium]